MKHRFHHYLPGRSNEIFRLTNATETDSLMPSNYSAPLPFIIVGDIFALKSTKAMETESLMSSYYSSSPSPSPHIVVGDISTTLETSTLGGIDREDGKETIWYMRIWLFGAGGAIVACVGILCNIITIAVLANFRAKSSAPFLLSCLALSDTIHLLFLLILENLTQLSKAAVIDPSYNNSPFVQGMYSKMWSVHFVTQTLSIYIVVVITLERYVVVCWPFKASTICSRTSARIAMAVVLLFALLINVPHYMAYGPVYFQNQPTTCSRIAMAVVLLFALLINVPHYMAYRGGFAWQNKTGTEQFYFKRTSFGASYFFQDIFYKWMQMTFDFIIPLTILLSFNTLSIVGLRRSMAAATGTVSRRESENRLTLMIACMTAIFFICELLAAIGHIMVSGYDSYSLVPDNVNRFVAVSDFLMMVNAAVNFAIYCVTGKKFRETFRKMFIPSNKCCHCIKRTPGGSNISSKRSDSDTKKTTLCSVSSRHENSKSDSLKTFSNKPLLNENENELRNKKVLLA